jgi:hypothetical protein
MRPYMLLRDRRKCYYCDRGLHLWILYDKLSNSYTFFCVRCYYEDFKSAVNNYIQGLEYGAEDLTKFKQALESKPKLIRVMMIL